MKTWQYLRLIGLMVLLSLTTCKQKDLGPSIDEAVGEYDALGEWTGDFNFQVTPRMFTVTKSTKADNLLNIRIEESQSRTENWEVKYLAGGRLVMDRQVVIALNKPYEYQEAVGRFTGDSLILGGLRSYVYILTDKATYCNYRAKKKR